MRICLSKTWGIRTTVCGLVVALSAGSATAKDETEDLRVQLDSPLRVAALQEDDLVTSMTFDAGDYARLKSLDRVLMTGFSVGRARSVDLDLRRVEVFSADAQVVLGSLQGDVPVGRPDVVLLSGHVAGDPDSLAFLGLSPHGTNGIIRTGEDTFVVSSGQRPRQDHAVVYNLTRLPAGAIQWRDFHCALDELLAQGFGNLEEDHGEVGNSSSAAAADGVVWVVDMAIETDWEFTGFLFGGDTDASGAYAATLVGAASEIYMRDLGTELVISYLRLWPDANDPWTGGDTADQLYEFRSYWRNNMGGVDRDLAHFLSGRNLGGGIAWVGVICSTHYGYAVSANIDGYFPYPLQDHHPQNWDIMVFSHETGHNFGAPHTHDMNPQIDGCGTGDCSVAPNGTIMSYCHQCSGGMVNIVLHFHERMIDEQILPYESNVSCDISAGPPAVYQDPVDTTACLGGVGELRVIATGASPLTIQWRKGGVEIPGALGSTLIFDPVEEEDVGDYDAVVSNSLGSVTSGSAALTTVECSAPHVLTGGRYLAITPQPPDSPVPVALHLSIPDLPCVDWYIGPEGNLRQTAFFQTGSDWSTVYVSDHDIVPETTYSVRTDFGTFGNPRLSDPVLATTNIWGDIVGEFVAPEWTTADGTADFLDISASVECFKNAPTAPPGAWCDIYPAYPDGVIDFNDIAATVSGFTGLPYPFDEPQCP